MRAKLPELLESGPHSNPDVDRQDYERSPIAQNSNFKFTVALRASVLAIVFRFLCSALADFPFGLKRNQLAGILGNLVPVSTVSGTLVTAAGRNSRTRNPQTCTKYE
jgi:hypothetical protein